ncbi:MAG TPA: hypothetical protein VLD65_06710 [Anaerolineales bacterium]|nr:hypothetical protein [Anaerolineales bacterium]
MNIAKIIGGIVCLVIAVILAILYFTLPTESLMFQVGERNLPWIPPIIFGVVGIILLATVRKNEEPKPSETVVAPAQDPEKVALNKRLESIGWGLFLVMLGGFALVPQNTIPRGVWSIGVGVIMLGLNIARYYYHIKMSGFTTFLGILSLIGGVVELLGFTSLDGALLLIILGAYLILKPWFEKHKVFGKAEEA